MLRKAWVENRKYWSYFRKMVEQVLLKELKTEYRILKKKVNKMKPGE